MGNLIFNIGKQTFNTQLLTSDWDQTDISFGTIYLSTTDIFFQENFTIYIPVNNNNNVSKTISLLIYADDPGYCGSVSPITIGANTGNTFSFTDQFTSYGAKTIRIEAYIDGVNYISTTFEINIYGYRRILTTTDPRILTTSDERVTI